MRRAFAAGQSGFVGGMNYRIVAGKKRPRAGDASDLRIDLRASSWVPVGMPLLFLLADFLYENEDALFPPRHGFEGGERLFKFLHGARVVGWEAATQQLTEERERAAARRAGVAA